MKIKTTSGNVTVEVDTSRFDAQFNKAQIRLNTLVVADSTPYIPFSQGQLRSQVDFPHGISGDEVRWYAPYAHYQYTGEVLTDELGRTYVGSGEVKNVHTGRPLNYHNGGGAEWFEEAKRNRKQVWIREVRRIGGGG